MILGRFSCAYCGKENEVTVDPANGQKQEYTEDCQVCCKPNRLIVTWEQEKKGKDGTIYMQPSIEALPETDLET